MKVDIFTKTEPVCPYCQLAKQYLSQHGIDYTETIYNDTALRHAMFDELGLTNGQRTVPQIFVVEPDGRRLIGGYHDLLRSDLAARIAVGDFNEDF